MNRVQKEYNQLVEILSGNELTNIMKEYLVNEKLLNYEKIKRNRWSERGI